MIWFLNIGSAHKCCPYIFFIMMLIHNKNGLELALELSLAEPRLAAQIEFVEFVILTASYKGLYLLTKLVYSRDKQQNKGGRYV